MGELICLDLGTAPYDPTLDLQRRLLAEVQTTDDGRAYLLLVEHDPPVITLGRRGRKEHILASPERLASVGVEVRRSRRGGQVTYHGPGQLVGYPILSLHGRGMTLREYVGRLERVLIGVLERFGIAARGGRSEAAVWVGDEKVAAIGVAVARWATYHGFALNVATDLSHFEWIVPCGLPRGRMTTLARLTGREISVAEARPHLVECFAEEFDFDPEEVRHEESTRAR